MKFDLVSFVFVHCLFDLSDYGSLCFQLQVMMQFTLVFLAAMIASVNSVPITLIKGNQRFHVIQLLFKLKCKNNLCTLKFQAPRTCSTNMITQLIQTEDPNLRPHFKQQMVRLVPISSITSARATSNVFNEP